MVYAEPPLYEWRRIERLFELGFATLENVPGTGIEEYALLPEGRRLLEEIASGKDTPFMLLARALLQDETASVLDQYPAAATLVRQESAAAIATRHARLVAHEIRNALVPIRTTLSDLYEEIERRGQADLLVKRRDRIDAGISRLFGFVRDIAQTASLGAEPAELFTSHRRSRLPWPRSAPESARHPLRAGGRAAARAGPPRSLRAGARQHPAQRRAGAGGPACRDPCRRPA